MQSHLSILYEEVLAGLDPQPGRLYVDCTLGAGGHAAGMLERSAPTGRLLGIDLDPHAVEVAAKRLAPFKDRMILVNDSFAHLQSIVECYSFGPIDGILFDLGVSSLQLTEASRGFSFQVDGPLDMRFNPTGEETAAALINKLGEDELAELLYRYGEERQSRRIARAIVASRPLRSTTELAELIAETIGRRGRLHPATKTFQALRIAVNDELGALEAALPQATAVLASSGRIAVVSFHSLEDRIVKDFFRNESRGCLCPPGVPVCTCHHQPTLRLVTKKPIRPSISEVETNPRSRSARLRIAVRL